MSECVVRIMIPVSCYSCELRTRCILYRMWLADEITMPKPLDDGCRILCQLPEGHGTLIDLEEAAEGLSERYNSCHMTCGAVMQFLDGLPTIVPARQTRQKGAKHENSLEWNGFSYPCHRGHLPTVVWVGISGIGHMHND